MALRTVLPPGVGLLDAAVEPADRDDAVGVRPDAAQHRPVPFLELLPFANAPVHGDGSLAAFREGFPEVGVLPGRNGGIPAEEEEFHGADSMVER